MSPQISILIPVYNAAATLSVCLQSILNQTLHDFEIIIVDDGSTDKTPQLLAEYVASDTRIKVFSQTHSGIVAALNHGITRCHGEYIARMDADDVMRPQRLEKQLAFAKQYPHIDLIGTQFQLVRENKEISPAQQRYQDWNNALIDDQVIKEGLFIESPIAHPTFFAKQSFFKRLGYQNNNWTEDYDFLLRASQQGAVFGKVPDILLDKHDQPDNLTRTDPRCKRPALFRAKAHYFAQGTWLKPEQEVFIAGSGSSGRQLAQALLAENINVAGFFDNVDSVQ